jgi:serine/threonine-protein kinase
MIAPGQVLGAKYVVERVLGAGAMGVVVAARHVALGHLVAIKTIKSEAAADAAFVARFEREAQAAAQLQSEHAARVTDVGRFEDGAPFMVMEFLEGEDLAERLEREGALPIGEAISLFMQCCVGLHDAHAIGLVHRDVKPSNVFLARRASGRLVAKVLDFGIAKAASHEGPGHALTQTSAVMG